MNTDPVSGNPVPPGALPQEVRDDKTVNVSEGEYVIPANVVRFYGLDKLEKMVSTAQEKLQELHGKGRMGGSSPDDLPFSPEELISQEGEEAPVEDVPAFAEGGLITGGAGAVKPYDPISDSTLFPFLPYGEQAAPQGVKRQASRSSSSSSSSSTPQPELTGLAASLDKWRPEDFVTYANTRDNPANKMANKAVGLIPVVGQLAGLRRKYLNNNAPEALKSLLERGVDAAGNPLSPEQLTQLQEASQKLSASADDKEERKTFLAHIVDSIKQKNEKAPTGKSDTSGSSYSTSANVTSGDKKQEDIQQTNGSLSWGNGYAKGGLITRR